MTITEDIGRMNGQKVRVIHGRYPTPPWKLHEAITDMAEKHGVERVAVGWNRSHARYDLWLYLPVEEAA